MNPAITFFAAPPITFGINQVFDQAFDSGWVQFPGHYLLYASTGAFHLEVGNARWLLPPQRAAWVAVGTPLRLTGAGTGATSSVLFVEQALPQFAFICRVFAVSALAREMLLYAMRWGADREPTPDSAANQSADYFFQSLATVCIELAAQPDELWLPQAQSTELRTALDYTLNNLGDALTVSDVARAVSVSERTLARRFTEETSMTWTHYVRRARMIRAMELLGAVEPKIIDIAYAVGFTSISAFNHAFREFTGETPSSYRKRMR
ncbi:helix-turn-helix transcriptional regulator [soil metagenome]